MEILHIDYCFRIGYNCFKTYLVNTFNQYCTPGHRLRKFDIIIGPYNGMYKRCGSLNTNSMSTAETKSFSCEANAIGSSLKIIIPGKKRILTLCEVIAFGKGTVDLNISIQINIRQK